MEYTSPGERRRIDTQKKDESRKAASRKQQKAASEIKRLFTELTTKGIPNASTVEVVKDIPLGGKYLTKLFSSDRYIEPGTEGYKNLASNTTPLEVIGTTIGWILPNITYTPEHGYRGDTYAAHWAGGILTVGGKIYKSIANIESIDGYAVLDKPKLTLPVSQMPYTVGNVTAILALVE